MVSLHTSLIQKLFPALEYLNTLNMLFLFCYYIKMYVIVHAGG